MYEMMSSGQYFSHHPKTASRWIGDEMVILDQERNVMVTLNESAGSIWGSCSGERTLDDIVETLLGQYDVDREILASEVKEFTHKMQEEGWLLCRPEPRTVFLDSELSQKRQSLVVDNDPRVAASQDIEDKIKERCLQETRLYAATLELTFSCNERCKHCYVVRDAEEKELSTQEWKNVIDQLADLGALRLVLTGGEPLLRPDFLELLRYARERRFAVDIFSNGQLLTEELTREIADRYPRTVQFSLYGMTPSVHDEITSVPGSWSKTSSAIEFCRIKNIPIALKMPLMTINFEEYPLVKDFAKSHGLGYQFNIAISPKNDGREDNLYLRVKDETLLRRYVTDEDINSSANSDFFFEGTRFNSNGMVPCGAGFNSLSISPVGEVYGCNQLLISFGNIRVQSFRDIWTKSEKLLEIRGITVDQLRPCSQCSDLTFCNRCPGLAHIEGGDVRGPSPFDCLIAKVRRNSSEGRKADEESV